MHRTAVGADDRVSEREHSDELGQLFRRTGRHRKPGRQGSEHIAGFGVVAWVTHIIGGAFEAMELDAKLAIEQGSKLAARL